MAIGSRMTLMPHMSQMTTADPRWLTLYIP